MKDKGDRKCNLCKGGGVWLTVGGALVCVEHDLADPDPATWPVEVRRAAGLEPS